VGKGVLTSVQNKKSVGERKLTGKTVVETASGILWHKNTKKKGVSKGQCQWYLEAPSRDCRTFAALGGVVEEMTTMPER